MTTPALLNPSTTTTLDLPTYRAAPAEWTAIVAAEDWQPISVLDLLPQRFRAVIGHSMQHALGVLYLGDVRSPWEARGPAVITELEGDE